jgi:hypothetical protein
MLRSLASCSICRAVTNLGHYEHVNSLASQNPKSLLSKILRQIRCRFAEKDSLEIGKIAGLYSSTRRILDKFEQIQVKVYGRSQ